MMKLNGYLDVLIPRGGAGLIRSVVENATVPGHRDRHRQLPHLCRRVRRPRNGAEHPLSTPSASARRVCNAAESLLVHQDVAAKVSAAWRRQGLAGDHVTIHGCARTTRNPRRRHPSAQPTRTTAANTSATRSRCKVVDSLDEAIAPHQPLQHRPLRVHRHPRLRRFAAFSGGSGRGGGLCQRLHALYRRLRVRLRRGDRHFHSEAARTRPDGTECADHDQVYHLRKRTGKSMNKTMEKEYKWRADELRAETARCCWASSRIGSQSRTIRMESQLFRYRGRDAAQ